MKKNHNISTLLKNNSGGGFSYAFIKNDGEEIKYPPYYDPDNPVTGRFETIEELFKHLDSL